MLVHFKNSHGMKNNKTKAVKYHIYAFIMWNIFLVPHCLPQILRQPVIDLKY